MELLATVDWLIHKEGAKPTVSDIKAAIRKWPGGPRAAERKMNLFDERLINLALKRISALNAA